MIDICKFKPNDFVRISSREIFFINENNQAELIQNHNHADSLSKDWLHRIISANTIDIECPQTKRTKFLRSKKYNPDIPTKFRGTFYRHTNGYFRPFKNEASTLTYYPKIRTLQTLANFNVGPDNDFIYWVHMSEMPLINPAQKYESSIDDVIWKIENGAKMASGRLKKDTASIKSCTLTQDPMGFPTENMLINLRDLTCSYFVSEIATVEQLKQFQSKYETPDYNDLMTLLAVVVKTKNDTSLLKGTDNLSLYFQSWFAYQSAASQDAIIDNICREFDTLPECACINRSRDPDYQKIAPFQSMSDSCWYMPCKNKTQYLIKNELANPTCPDVCQIITQYLNNNNITLSNNSNVINCNNVEPKPPTPVEPDTFLTFDLAAVCLIILLLGGICWQLLNKWNAPKKMQ